MPSCRRITGVATSQGVHVHPRAEKKFLGRNSQGKVVNALPGRAKSQLFEHIFAGRGIFGGRKIAPPQRKSWLRLCVEYRLDSPFYLVNEWRYF